ncbi:hypothetical protein [Flavobacterium sp. W22_SRS_FP1]|uniref:hypothetical protein n=1 Tax=Flavobacterium sp. W22_SRS_FP1 TaxID=3240276 RepID=UPI003F8FCDC9
MNPSQLKAQISLDGCSLTDQQNLEIWALLDKIARIEFDLYLEEKKSSCEGNSKSIIDISHSYKEVA